MKHAIEKAKQRALFEAELFLTGRHIFTNKQDLLNDAANSLALHRLVRKSNPTNLCYAQNYLYYHTLYHNLFNLLK